MKHLNIKKFFRLYLPSLVFSIYTVTLAIASNMGVVNIIAGSVALLIIVNLFLENKIIRVILGTIFLLCSSYMLLALFDDVVDGEATIGYIFGLFLILFSIAMAILFLIGYDRDRLQINYH